MSARPLFALRYCGWLEYVIRVVAETVFLAGVIWLLTSAPWFGHLPLKPRVLIIAACAVSSTLTVATLRLRREVTR